MGFFAKYGMSDVDLSKQASWGSMRITLKWLREVAVLMGSISDAMPHLITEGQITKGNRENSNVCPGAVNYARKWDCARQQARGKRAGAKLRGGKDTVRSAEIIKTPFTAAYTFAQVNQDFWIRYWLAAGGINPDTDVKVDSGTSSPNCRQYEDGDDGCQYRRRPGRTALSGQDWLHVSIDGGNVEKSPEEYFAMRADGLTKSQGYQSAFERHHGSAAVVR